MAVVRSFRALRPEPHAAAAVAAVPYDVVSTDEARALAVGEPLSFLHVTRPEIDLAPGVDVYGDSVYDTARVNLARLRATAPLVVEARPALYVYRLRDGDHTQVGVAGCFSLDEYDDGTIKKHERTRPDKEDDRTRHMVAIEAQTGVVFLTYRQTTDIDTAVDQVCDGDALFDFVAADGIQHTVWRATAGQTAGLVTRFGPVPALYISDGHHRAAHWPLRPAAPRMAITSATTCSPLHSRTTRPESFPTTVRCLISPGPRPKRFSSACRPGSRSSRPA